MRTVVVEDVGYVAKENLTTVSPGWSRNPPSAPSWRSSREAGGRDGPLRHPGDAFTSSRNARTCAAGRRSPTRGRRRASSCRRGSTIEAPGARGEELSGPFDLASGETMFVLARRSTKLYATRSAKHAASSPGRPTPAAPTPLPRASVSPPRHELPNPLLLPPSASAPPQRNARWRRRSARSDGRAARDADARGRSRDDRRPHLRLGAASSSVRAQNKTDARSSSAGRSSGTTPAAHASRVPRAPGTWEAGGGSRRDLRGRCHPDASSWRLRAVRRVRSL